MSEIIDHLHIVRRTAYFADGNEYPGYLALRPRDKECRLVATTEVKSFTTETLEKFAGQVAEHLFTQTRMQGTAYFDVSFELPYSIEARIDGMFVQNESLPNAERIQFNDFLRKHYFRLLSEQDDGAAERELSRWDSDGGGPP